MHAKGLLGVGWPSLAGARLILVSSEKGLFYFSPCLLLAIPGAPRLAGTRDGRRAIVAIVLAIATASALVFPGGGWTVGPRHLAVCLPFLVLAVGAGLPRWAPFLPGLAIASIAACFGSLLVFPHYPDTLANPLFQLGWPLLRDGFVPPSPTGIPAIGLGLGIASIAVWAVLRMPGARPARSVATAAVLLGLMSLRGRERDAAAERLAAEALHATSAAEPSP